MKAIPLLLVLILASSCLGSRDIAESTLLGDWCAGSPNAFHEELSLSIEDGARVFSSWLHHRPAESGTWELNGRTFTIRGSSGSTTSYTIVRVSRNRLLIRQADAETEVYVRERCLSFDPEEPASGPGDGK